MTIIRWSMVAPLDHPMFVIATLLFIAGAVWVARSTLTVLSAIEMGALYGFVYGVIVWGLLGYYFSFDGQAKLLFAGSSILDGVWLCGLLHYVLHRLRGGTAAE